MKEELIELISTYNQILYDHKIPIDMTTKEQYRLEGGDARLISVIYDLNEILKQSRDNDDDTNKRLYQE